MSLNSSNLNGELHGTLTLTLQDFAFYQHDVVKMPTVSDYFYNWLIFVSETQCDFFAIETVFHNVIHTKLILQSITIDKF
jgi:hypothetical protein